VSGRGNLFLTGATGSIGRSLALAAVQAGFSVRALVLPGEDATALEASGVTIHRGTVESAKSLADASQGTTHAVHCAALLPHLHHLGREAYSRVNVEGSRSMAQLATKRHWSRAVFLSTCGVLDREPDGPTTDATHYRQPYDLYTWSKIEAEKAVVAEAHASGAPAVVLRPANVYGPGMAFKWPEVFAMVRAGTMKTIGGGRAPFAMIHVRDLVRAILLALDERRPIPRGERILICSPEQLTFGEVLSAVARALDAPGPGDVPYPVALLAAIVARALPAPLRLGRLRLLDPALVREYRQGFCFDASHAERVLGFRAEEEFPTGIAEAVAEWKAGAA
jgi:nucleoside-diphosphate-sugar epimerase